MRSLTPRIALELLAHEGIVPEAYRDSAGVWTWSVGITDASGHLVHPRYVDKPQPLEHCLGVYLWVLRTRYLPSVLAAFGDHDPAEHELGAALSFHYNTGAIARATWCRSFVAGDREAARAEFMNWSRPAAIVPRRQSERDLFFDGTWTSDGSTMIYDVAKPSYRPVRGRRIAVAGLLASMFVDESQAAGGRISLPPKPAPEPQRTSWFDWLFT
jgi:lysozyme